MLENSNVYPDFLKKLDVSKGITENDVSVKCSKKNIKIFKKYLHIDKRINCFGAVQPDGRSIYYDDPYDIDETNDLVCLLATKRNVVLLTQYKPHKYRNHKSKDLIEALINLVTNCKCKIITYYDKKNDLYAFAVYKKDHLSDALLALYAYTDGISETSQYIKGKLVGYAENNIYGFFDSKEEYYKQKSQMNYILNYILNSQKYRIFVNKYQHKVSSPNKLMDLIL